MVSYVVLDSRDRRCCALELEINPPLATFVPSLLARSSLRWNRSACKGGFVQHNFI